MKIITDVYEREVLDSRGNPTVEVEEADQTLEEFLNEWVEKLGVDKMSCIPTDVGLLRRARYVEKFEVLLHYSGEEQWELDFEVIATNLVENIGFLKTYEEAVNVGEQLLLELVKQRFDKEDITFSVEKVFGLR